MVKPFLPEPSLFSDRPLNKLSQAVGLHGNHQTVTNERNKRSKERESVSNITEVCVSLKNMQLN